MKIERVVGLLFFLAILFFTMYFFYPKGSDLNTSSQNFKTEEPVTIDSKTDSSNDTQFQNFTESDFDVFVYRAHILSSKVNANNLKDNINNGGFPAFIETYGDKQELFAIYVGPFLTEDDIVNNMKLIQELSESNNGEISRWKL